MATPMKVLRWSLPLAIFLVVLGFCSSVSFAIRAKCPRR